MQEQERCPKCDTGGAWSWSWTDNYGLSEACRHCGEIVDFKPIIFEQPNAANRIRLNAHVTEPTRHGEARTGDGKGNGAGNGKLRLCGRCERVLHPRTRGDVCGICEGRKGYVAEAKWEAKTKLRTCSYPGCNRFISANTRKDGMCHRHAGIVKSEKHQANSLVSRGVPCSLCDGKASRRYRSLPVCESCYQREYRREKRGELRTPAPVV